MPKVAISAVLSPPSPGTKPMSSPPTRAAALCSTQKPFQPSLTAPNPTAALAASERIVAPSGRASAPAPTRTSGLFACLSVSAKSPRPAASSASVSGAPALADARVEHRRLAARIGAHDQQRVRLLDAGDGGVEQIGRPAPFRVERLALLAAIEILRAEP